MSRLYRSPEVILLQKNYGKSADVWSVGCVLLDLMLTLAKKPLTPFNGDFCSPLSPREHKELDSSCQLVKILERFPDLDPKIDFSYTETDDCYSKIGFFQLDCNKKMWSISDLFSCCNPELVLMVLSMLEFNPYFRPSCFELL